MSFNFPQDEPALLLIISGPAGCGKTTLCDALIASDRSTERAVTGTTRTPRPGEIHGKDYYFFTAEGFEEAVAGGEFLENAGVHGARYGTLKQEVQSKLMRDVTVVLNIDVQGAASLRAKASSDPLLDGRLISIFVLPPSLEILRERMLSRGADDASSIQQRLINAENEMRQWSEYDYCIRSGSREDDFHQLQSIVTAERRRVKRLLARNP
jgi:guanylate kinase